MIKDRFIIFIAVLCIFGMFLYSENVEEVEPEENAELTEQAILDSICSERGHIIFEFELTRSNVMREVIDYPDSTVVLYYKDNIQKGTISRCDRCGKWMLPKLQPPRRWMSWKIDKSINKEEENLGGK